MKIITLSETSINYPSLRENREEQSVGREEGFGVVGAPVTTGGDGDVQRMENSEGVRFSVDSEARERRGRAWRPSELHELRRCCELEVVAPVLQASETTDEPRELRRDPNGEVA